MFVPLFSVCVARVKTLYRNDKGSFSIYFSIAFLAVFTAVSVAIDVSILYSTREKLQIVADNAALNAINGTLELDGRGMFFSETVKSLAKLDERLTNITTQGSATFEDSELIVNGRVEADVKTMFVQNLGYQPRLVVNVETRRGLQKVEIALVIDISSSMRGTRIAEAKAASKNFVDIMLEDPLLKGRISLSLVPFGGTVKIPSGLEFLIRNPSTLKDPVFQQHWIGGMWNRCLLFELNDLNRDLKPTDRFETMEDV